VFLVIDSEKGSSLIWFINLIALVVLIILMLSVGISEFQSARKVKLFADQYAIAIMTLTQQGNSLDQSRQKLDSVIHAENEFKLEVNFMQDGKTLEVLACKLWNTPIPLVQADRMICERSRAR